MRNLFEVVVNKAGGMTIPATLRRQFGVESKDKFKVEQLEGGKILLTPFQKKCFLCGSTDDQLEVKFIKGVNHCICKKCEVEILASTMDTSSKSLKEETPKKTPKKRTTAKESNKK